MGCAIEDAEIIEKILTYLDMKAVEPQAPRRPPCRAAPQRALFDERGDPTMTPFERLLINAGTDPAYATEVIGTVSHLSGNTFDLGPEDGINLVVTKF